MSAKRSRYLVYSLILVAAIALLFNLSVRTRGTTDELPLSTLASQISQGAIEQVVIRGDQIKVVNRLEGQSRFSRKESGIALSEALNILGVSPADLQDVTFISDVPSSAGRWLGLVFNLLPVIFIGGLFLLIMRQSQGANSQAMMFGKSKARMVMGETIPFNFQAVAGNDEAKEELQEVVEFLQEPQKFIELGARIPAGVLLVGPPGTGKTLMAKAAAGEANVPFFTISGSEFVEMFVGVGASRVRDLFEQARKASPCIIFIDEIDAVGRYRGTGLGGSHDEREQTLNQILVEMDGFDTDTSVIMIAATNRPDILDPALLRPGRFDRRVVMDRPDIKGRKSILDVHIRGKPVSPDIDLAAIARQSPGLVGADLENVVNESAILAARAGRDAITMADLQEALERVALGGPQRRSRLITDEEKQIVAYHEAGHALVARLSEHADPVHLITIMARGMAGGYTMMVPENDRFLVPRSWFLSQLDVSLGGRVAEEIEFGSITNGASGDIQQLTAMVRAMVTRYAMTDDMGQVQYGQQQELVFLGRDMAEQRSYSAATGETIDGRIRAMVQESHARVAELLKKHKEQLDAVASALLTHETLNREEFEIVFSGEALPEPDLEATT
ncbi:MAG: ATP-dependent zinc metalloprotease FtsH [Caldilineaceae bacterium]|nr:ATP-dependent zinc metalloprotease FtsH [Caldilineaceae bacterium]